MSHLDKEVIVLDKFPKIRPPLPEDIEEIYTKFLSSWHKRRSDSSFANKMESWLHEQVASDLKNSDNFNKSTLELGAGSLNQLKYEPKVNIYDIVEPYKDSYNSNLELLKRIRNIYPDISEVPSNFRYDRITSVATLEHLCDLPKVIAKSGLLLTERGVFRASVPSEGTFLWKLGWKLTTGLEFKIKYGLNYDFIMRHEHVNTAREIEEVLRHFFTKVECKFFGLSKSLSLYQSFECQIPRVDRCSSFLDIS